MAGERLKELLGTLDAGIVRAEELLAQLNDVREDVNEAVDARVAELRAALAGLREQLREVEALLE